MTFPVNIKALKEIDKSYQKSHLLVNYICVRIMARSILDPSLDTGLLTFCNKLQSKHDYIILNAEVLFNCNNM